MGGLRTLLDEALGDAVEVEHPVHVPVPVWLG